MQLEPVYALRASVGPLETAHWMLHFLPPESLYYLFL